jgi:putative SOS response-associated peptidase YedK
MCGRFVLASTFPAIAQEYNIDLTPSEFNPSYNIAPGQNIFLIIHDKSLRLIQCRWGFVPAWSNDHSVGYKMINARAETVSEKPAFKSAFKKHRCLIVADGFYEWRKKDKRKFPVYIHLKSGKPFGLAGLYNSWASQEGEQICTCTIITTRANTLLEPIHNRMPVIIPKEKQDLWLDPEVQDKTIVLPLLEPYPSDEMKAYEVSPRVNSAGYNSPKNIKPIR